MFEIRAAIIAVAVFIPHPTLAIGCIKNLGLGLPSPGNIIISPARAITNSSIIGSFLNSELSGKAEIWHIIKFVLLAFSILESIDLYSFEFN